jgi:hypothetical protein
MSNPQSAQPMARISPKGKAFLASKKHGFAVAIEPKGEALKRYQHRKAAI